MNTAIARKPKAQIVRREQTGNTVLYYILQGDHLHEVTIEDGKAICNCHAYQFASRGNKRCGDTDLAQQNESERATDIQQHVHDDIHSCIYCGRPMTYDGVCARCA